MRTRTRSLVVLLAGLAALLGLGAVSPAAQAEPAEAAATGLHIENGRLLERNGNDFVMRGVNHPHTWFQGETQSFADIKALGANTVRVVLGSGQRWGPDSPENVAGVVEQCKVNRMICALEVHDTTGYGEEAAAASLDQAADYWIGLKDVLVGEEDYVVINIGNEPWGNVNAAGWTQATIDAVGKLRGAGFEHTLMVDAPNWGQDWENTMRTTAQAVYDADPTGNLIFSVHMYAVYDTAEEINGYLQDFVDARLPILVGEFSHPDSEWGDVNEDVIMATAEELDLGYLAWSWSGNSDPIHDLVLNFDPNQLTWWGERVFHGPNGIAETAREATVFGGGAPDDTEAPTAPGTPTASAVTATTATLSWTASTDDVGVTGYDIVRVDSGTETRVASSTSNRVTVTGLTAGTGYTFAVYAKDAAGNRSARSGTVSVATPDSPAGSCSVGYRVVGDWGSGFQGEIVIRNTGTTALDGWTLGFSFTGGQVITTMWGGTPTQSEGSVSVAPASYTRAIPAGGSVTLGFVAGRGATNTAPTGFTLNGGTCATA
ncbi:cellulase family glycosylhydrolase [Streptomyces litchfieldiae]|uniref:Endoglucanase n=1 Tax=Streptomyces litchfieldiae TaxID=3075543 RepID=A0ABU2N1S0_9ACTN|nr:cellulase family glycosylhydrolase [Streptomyces sp. DSM 44938]MDT0347458.1 cellulase family glycosylhydrolase [Streptomyces sp. DSM 44938]